MHMAEDVGYAIGVLLASAAINAAAWLAWAFAGVWLLGAPAVTFLELWPASFAVAVVVLIVRARRAAARVAAA